MLFGTRLSWTRFLCASWASNGAFNDKRCAPRASTSSGYTPAATHRKARNDRMMHSVAYIVGAMVLCVLFWLGAAGAIIKVGKWSSRMARELELHAPLLYVYPFCITLMRLMPVLWTNNMLLLMILLWRHYYRSTEHRLDAALR